ncbi:hypothetical protein J7K03_01380 [bacterium]|nr:hypothetical protein [bacterium]
MRKLVFGILLIFFFFSFAQSALATDHFCTLYFTFIGCPNCAVCDPLVLDKWTKEYPNLVVIEYGWHGGNWQDPNSQFFGEYAKVYKTPAAVPTLVIDKNNIKVGRIEVLKAQEDIEKKEANLCTLIDKSISFEKLDLSKLSAFPKIWANGRILIKLNENEWLFQWDGEEPPKTIGREKFSQEEFKELLFAKNISERLKNKIFEIVEPQKVEFSGSAFPDSGIPSVREFEHAIKINLSETLTSFSEEETNHLSQATTSEFKEETLDLPIIGKIETEKFSLPILTLLIGLADGFNPCAFFVLTFLLAALIGLAGARKKILLVGGIFAFLSGFFYFLFMSLLLNVFQLGGGISILTIIAGLIAVFAGAVNIKDYFYFQKGISLTLPKSYKEKFIQRVKNLSLAQSTFALIIGTVIIAATVNIYELLCTFGFPMVYTRILTLRNLPTLKYYLYLVFYNLVYIIPLLVIVLVFAITLGRKTFSQLWVRRLKLISGFMILFLGFILILKPKLLENVLTAFGALIGAIIIAGVVFLLHSFFKKIQKIK